MSKRKDNQDTAENPVKKIRGEFRRLPKVIALLQNVLQQSLHDGSQHLEAFDQSRESNYQASGVKRALHGTIYQLKLLMLVFKRAFDVKRYFELATEWDEAEKFDDVVIRWEAGNRADDGGAAVPKNVRYQFLQAKHKSDDKELISTQNLFNENDDEAFSLKKYFYSYQKLKERFGKTNIHDLIICTNINFNPDLGGIQLIPQSIRENTKIFHIENKSKVTLWNKLRFDTIPPEMFHFFRNTSDLRLLANDLSNCIRKNGKIDLTNQRFKKYCHALASNVINFTTMTFHSSFFTSLKNDVVVFRRILSECLHLTEAEMQNLLERKSFNKDILISKDFIKYCVSNPVPRIVDSTELAKKMIVALTSKKAIRIEKRAKLIRDNVSCFPGNVLEVTVSGEIKFTKSFLDPTAPVRGNVADLRLKLHQEVTACGHCNWKDLSEFTFTIADFPDIRSENYDDYFTLPSVDITLDEIKDFFNCLIFATNTPNESDLSNIVAAEFANISVSSGTGFTDLITGNYMESVLNWMKLRDAYWLTQSKAENYFAALQQKISALQLVGVSLDNLISFQNSGIECTSDDMFCDSIDTFLADPSKFVLLIQCEGEDSSWVNWLKISDIFQKTGITDVAMYAPLSTIFNLKENILLALKSTKPFFLVCYCDVSAVDLDLRQVMAEVLGPKKIIFVMDVQKYEHFSNIFAASRTTSMVASDVSLSHLSNKSKEYFLRKKISFQGHEVCLEQILDVDGWSFLKSSDLVNLFKLGTFRVGHKPPASVTYYIDRTLHRSGYSLTNLKNIAMFSDIDVITVSGAENRNENMDNLIYLSTTDPSTDYERFVNRNPDKNVHWLHQLQSTDPFVVHIRSVGSLGCISKLKSMLWKGRECRILETEIGIYGRHERICVISAAPGMGKSETLKKLMESSKADCNKTTMNVFIVWLNLLDWTNNLKDIKFDSICDVLDFLYITQRLETKFDQNFLKHSLETTGRIQIFVDGFDEIVPDYGQQIFNFLKILSTTRAQKIYIATRTSSVFQLEIELNISPYHLDAFSFDDQVSFISSYWKAEVGSLMPEQNDNPSISKSITANKLRHLAEKLILEFNERILSEQVSKFIGVPLQAQMLADIYLPDVVKDKDISFADKEILNMDTYDLYSRFIAEKYSRYLSRFVDPSVPGIGSSIAHLKRLYSDQHERLALQDVFPLHAAYVLQTQNEKDFSFISGIGIVYFSSDGSRKFVHRTFSEFLVGVFLAKEAQNSTTKFKALLTEKDKLWHPERKMIRYFFDRYLARGATAHIAVLNQNAVALQQLYSNSPQSWFLALDSIGRTPIHLIASYGLRSLLTQNLELCYTAFNVKDQLYGWNPVKYAAQIEDWYFTVHQLFTGASASDLSTNDKSSTLLYAVKSCLLHRLTHFWSVIENEQKFEEIISTTDEAGHNILHLALRNEGEVSLNFLIGKLKHFPKIFKSLLIAKDNSNSRYTPIFFIHTKRLSLEEKDNYQNILFQAMKDSLSAEDIKDILLTTDTINTTLLHYAAEQGNTSMLRHVLDGLDEVTQANLLAMRDITNATSIEKAMQEGHLLSAHLLLKFKSPTTGLTKEEISTLTEFVVENGNNYKLVSATSMSSLRDEEETLKSVVEKEPTELEEYLNITDRRLRTILHDAVEDGNLMIVKAIIQKLNANDQLHLISQLYRMQDDLGRAPFHLAVQNGDIEMVDVMIAALNGNTSIFRAISLLIDTYRMSALHMAAQLGYLSIVTSIIQQLLQDCYEGESEDDKLTYLMKLLTMKDSYYGYTIIHSIIAYEHSSVLEFILNVFQHHPVLLTQILSENSVKCDDGLDDQLSSFLLCVRQDNVNCFEILLDCLKDYPNDLQYLATSTSTKGSCALHFAAFNGATKLLGFLVSLDVVDKMAYINQKDHDNGNTPLHFACLEGQVESVRILLQSNANVNLTNILGLTPFHLSVSSGSLQLLNLLIEHNADIHAKSNDNLTAVHLAVIEKFPILVRRLLEAGAGDFCDSVFGTLYHFACDEDHGDLETLNVLLDVLGVSNCNAPCQSLNQRMPLHLAANCGYYSLVEVLLAWVNKGILVDPTDGDGFTPLCLAAANGDEAMVELFLRNNADIELTNPQGYSLLLLAIKKSETKMFHNLFKYGASINKKSLTELTCLHFAAANGNLEILRMCLNSGIDVNAETNRLDQIETDVLVTLLPTQISSILLNGDSAGTAIKSLDLNINFTPLHVAAAWGRKDVCSELILSGAATNSEVYPPLFAAIITKNSDPELLGLLATNHDDDTRDIFGRTMFHWVAISGNLTNVQYVLNESRIQRKELFSKVDKDRRTPLHCAVAFCRTETVKYLLQQYTEVCLEISTMDYDGHTPLHTALRLSIEENENCSDAACQRIKILNNFLNAEPRHLKKRLKFLDHNENTPLIVAAISGFYDGCERILELCRADLDDSECKEIINKQNLQTQSALHVAVKLMDLKLVNLLLYYGSDPMLVNGENKSAVQLAEESCELFRNEQTDRIKTILARASETFKSD